MNPTRTLAQALATSPAAGLLARVAAAERVAEILTPECARLRLGFDPGSAGRFDVRDTEVLINVDSAAQAAKLRQALPRLTQALATRGFGGLAVKVKVAPPGGRDASDEPQSHGPAREPNAAGATAVGELAGDLAAEEPESRLARMLGKLARTLGRRKPD